MDEFAAPLSPRTDDHAPVGSGSIAPVRVAPARVPPASAVAPRRPAPAPARTQAPAPAPSREPLWRHVLGEHLRSLRHERGETLAETAGRAGLSPQYLSEVERGIKEPSSEMIAALGGALDVTLVDLTIAVADNLKRTRAMARSTPVCHAAFALAA